jgi:hypothetical protein
VTRRTVRAAPLLLATLIAASCASLVVPDANDRPTPLRPVWRESVLAEHLRYFNSTDADGRTTGSQGYARAAAYVAARMREFRLQPVLGTEFRMVYTTPMNHPVSASLAIVETDTLYQLPGIDFLVDGRTDSGRVVLSEAVLLPDGDLQANLHGVAVFVESAHVTPGRLQRWADAGARAVLIEGDLAPVPASSPVRGLLILQVVPETAARLAQAPGAPLLSQISTGEAVRVWLPRKIMIGVTSEHRPHSGAINVLGYVPGKHPAHANDLVIVCSDLDARGRAGSARAVDLARFGTGTSALLELARNYGAFSGYSVIPERTVLFAVWSGSLYGHAGLREYLEKPVWALDKTRAVVYVGLAPEQESEVRSILEERGIALIVVPRSAVPHGGAVLVLPDPGMRRLALDRRQTIPPPPVQIPQVVADEVASARALAQDAHEVLLGEIVTPVPLVRMAGDTLRIPVPGGS